MPERINAGQILVVAGAVALFVSLFLNWYEGPFAGDGGLSGWTAFELLDIVLAGLALAAIAGAVPLPRSGTTTPIAARWLPLVGIAAFVLVAITLLNDPPGARDRGLEIGAWVALAGAAALAVGGLLSLARVSLVVTTRPTESDETRTRTQPLHTEVDLDEAG
jgi:hypothetical protein